MLDFGDECMSLKNCGKLTLVMVIIWSIYCSLYLCTKSWLHFQVHGFVFILLATEFARLWARADVTFVLYGLSAFVMWLRTLHFILVQRELGQVSRKSYNQN